MKRFLATSWSRTWVPVGCESLVDNLRNTAIFDTVFKVFLNSLIAERIRAITKIYHLSHRSLMTLMRSPPSVFSPILVAPGAHILHGSETTRDAGESVEVVQNCAPRFQVVRVSCGLV